MKQGQGGGFNQDKIRDSWRACQKNHYRNTIRDIQSVEITLITDEMCDEVAKHPYHFQSLGIFKWSLVGWLKKIIKGDGPIPFDEEDWLIKTLEPNNVFGGFENDEDVLYKLSKFTDFQNVPAQVYLNSKYFGYHEMFGFNWQYDYSFNYASPKKDLKVKQQDFKPLTKDTFYQHNMGLIGAFDKEFLGDKGNKLDFAFADLAKYLEAEIQSQDFTKLIRLMIILHDYGKLNGGWQKPMQYYQASKENTTVAQYKEILAHTDYNSNDATDIELAKKANLLKRPAHAGVGAYVAQELESDLFISEYLKSAISMAIARHHSPLSDTYPDFDVNDTNYCGIRKLFKEFEFDIELERKDLKGNLSGFETDWHGEYIVYLFFVRILRLCDQKATENLSHYYKAVENV